MEGAPGLKVELYRLPDALGDPIRRIRGTGLPIMLDSNGMSDGTEISGSSTTRLHFASPPRKTLAHCVLYSYLPIYHDYISPILGVLDLSIQFWSTGCGKLLEV